MIRNAGLLNMIISPFQNPYSSIADPSDMKYLISFFFILALVPAQAQVSFDKSKEVNYFLGDTFARSSDYLRIFPSGKAIAKAVKRGKRKGTFPSEQEADEIVNRIEEQKENYVYTPADYADLAKVLGKSIYEHNDYLGLRFHARSFIKGFEAGKNDESRFTAAERRKIGSTLAEKVLMAETDRARRTAQQNLIRGKDFFEKNRNKAGVKTLESGVQYEILAAGEGKPPAKNSRVTVHYGGSLLDGTIFDSSYKRGEPITFFIRDMIKGWQEVLPLMNPGSKWRVYIPSNLGYGRDGVPGVIPPNASLVFEIELIEVNK